MKVTEFPTINSKDNHRLKHVRAVRDGRDRGAMFVEGTRLVRELIRSQIDPISVFATEEFLTKNVELVSELSEVSKSEIYSIPSKLFVSITDTENSQGIISIAERPQRRSFGSTEGAANSLFVFLNQINNPSNLGAVVRTAEAAGVAGVMTSLGSTDVYSSKSIRASMGSAFRLPIFSEISLDEASAIARDMGIRVVAADISGETSYSELSWKGPTLLVFGSEAHGLDERELGLVDETIVIPMENGVESLNLAVSAGVILFEAKRQRSNTES